MFLLLFCVLLFVVIKFQYFFVFLEINKKGFSQFNGFHFCIENQRGVRNDS